METKTLTWAAMLGLITAAGACSATTSTGSNAKPVYPASHPCFGKSNCDSYLSLPDGGAAPAPASGDNDAGVIRMCGPCNG